MSASDNLSKQLDDHKLVTPEHLKKIVKHFSKTTEVQEEVDSWKDPISRGSGNCARSAAIIHKWLPVGSETVQYDGGKWNAHDYTNHFVNHVPTTEGTYVVDLTHGQFHEKAPLTVVEHVNDYHSRDHIKAFGNLKYVNEGFSEYEDSKFKLKSMSYDSQNYLRRNSVSDSYDPPSSPVRKPKK